MKWTVANENVTPYVLHEARGDYFSAMAARACLLVRQLYTSTVTGVAHELPRGSAPFRAR